MKRKILETRQFEAVMERVETYIKLNFHFTLGLALMNLEKLKKEKLNRDQKKRVGILIKQCSKARKK